MTLLYHCADLLWSARLAAAAQAASVTYEQIADPEEATASVRRLHGDACAIIDLTAADALEVIASLHLARQELGCETKLRIVAFGPHVDRDRFASASAAGADKVVPRGWLVKHLNSVLLS